ncbi:CDP-diacylglycerol--glycerol-3-phosphate 3-phosphatidyltransferase [Synechococcus sp. PCC 7336]|uniref:CDP-diacylglycerol--glycerol-3-phosphate 3-phosphatidyltransferase n=1 Tax=Synechococcus sp. PCC 7336 TaxID=195250 RepID=UPI00035CB8DC|nr:CDP-diacylglycerol--glycerol-3-phosphate 3-phosphatidyltransferase [Synechococcus sp. PCC 7336]
MNLPTWITLSRLLAVPAILIGLTLDTPVGRWLSLAVFLLGAGTDWLDGYLARRLDLVTDLGKLLDPLVDKLLVLAPLLCLVQLQQIPAWGVFAIVARELGISTWRSQARRVTGANLWGKLKTVLQIVAIAVLIAFPGWWVGQVCFWGAVVLTLWSGWLYVRPLPQPESVVEDG